MKTKHLLFCIAGFMLILTILSIGYSGFLKNTLLPSLIENSLARLDAPISNLHIRENRALGILGDSETEDGIDFGIEYEPNRWFFPSRVLIKFLTLRGDNARDFNLILPSELLTSDFQAEVFDNSGELIRSEKIRDSGMLIWEQNSSGAIYSGYSDPESGVDFINFAGNSSALATPFRHYPPIYTGFPAELKLSLNSSGALSGIAVYDPKVKRFTAVKYLFSFGEKDFLSIGARSLRGLGRGTIELDYTSAESWHLRISDALAESPLRGRLMNVSIVRENLNQLDFDFSMEFYYGAFKQILGLERSVKSSAPVHRFMGKLSLSDQSWELSRVDMSNDSILRAPLRGSIGNVQLTINAAELKLLGHGDSSRAFFEYDARLDSGSIRLPDNWDINTTGGRLKGSWNIPVLGDFASAELTGQLSFQLADGTWLNSPFSLDQPTLLYRYFPGAERGSLQLNCSNGSLQRSSGGRLVATELSGEAKFARPLKAPHLTEWSGSVIGQKLEYFFAPMRNVTFGGAGVSGTMIVDRNGLSDLQLNLQTKSVSGQSGRLSISGKEGTGSVFLLQGDEGGNILRSNLNFANLNLSGGELNFDLQDARCVIVESASNKASMLLIDAPVAEIYASSWGIMGKSQAAVCNFIWDKSEGKTVENDCFATFNSVSATLGDSISATIPQLNLKYRSDPSETGHGQFAGLAQILFRQKAKEAAFELPFTLGDSSKLTDGSVTFDGLILNGISGDLSNMTIKSIAKEGMNFVNNSVKIQSDGQNLALHSLFGEFGSGNYHLIMRNGSKLFQLTNADAGALCALLGLPSNAITGKVFANAQLDDDLTSGLQINENSSWRITGEDGNLKLGFLAPRAEENDAKNLTLFTLAALENFIATDFSIQRNSDGSFEVEAHGHAAELLPFEYDAVTRTFNPVNRPTFGSDVTIKMRYRK